MCIWFVQCGIVWRLNRSRLKNMIDSDAMANGKSLYERPAKIPLVFFLTYDDDDEWNEISICYLFCCLLFVFHYCISPSARMKNEEKKIIYEIGIFISFYYFAVCLQQEKKKKSDHKKCMQFRGPVCQQIVMFNIVCMLCEILYNL